MNKLKVILLYSSLLFVSASICLAEESVKLILDSPDNKEEVLRNFRMCSDISKINNCSTEGLASLQCSGSAEPSGKGFAVLRKSINAERLLIVDLREESHGFINETYPISWYGKNNWANSGKSLSEINVDELSKLYTLASSGKEVSLSDKKSESTAEIVPKSVQRENDIASQNSIIYFRLPVTDRKKPSSEAVDIFVELVKKMPKDTWFHFHCKEGHGRTTSFMSMFDMMHNADKVSFDDILKRQHLIGGTDLTDTNAKTSKKLNKESEKRLVFLKSFYDYCRENIKDNFSKSWGDWRKLFNNKKDVA